MLLNYSIKNLKRKNKMNEEDKKEKFVLNRNFDIKSATDNFYADSEVIIAEIYELFVEKSPLPEEYKKILFQEILRAILQKDYSRIRERMKKD